MCIRDRAVEVAQGADEFGLVVRVPVVPVRGVQGDPQGVLGGETGPGLVERGVGLDGDRDGRGEDLEQERQGGPEPGHRGGPQLALGVCGDQLVQPARPLAPVGPGGVAGVGAHPELGLRFAGRLLPEQLGERGDGPPGVRADGVDELVHGGGPAPLLRWAGGPGRRAAPRGRCRRWASGQRPGIDPSRPVPPQGKRRRPVGSASGGGSVRERGSRMPGPSVFHSVPQSAGAGRDCES